tara:strand:- start:27 stop:458 length:432 start_codon:yes stop_codon:yes gene_type:complete
MARVLGMNCKAYYGTAGVSATSELSNIRDVTINLSTEESDVTSRANSGWKQTMATLKDGSVDFEMIYDTADAGFTAFATAWENSTEIAAAFLDGSGGTGLWSDFTVVNFSRNESLSEAVSVSVSLKPSGNTDWGSSAPSGWTG